MNLYREKDIGNREAIINSSNKLIIDPVDLTLALDGIDLSGRVIIKGDLEVKGTQTIVNSTEVDISDNVITLDARYNTTDDNGLGGIAVRTNFTSDNDSIKKFVWNNNTKSWTTKGEQFDCSFITIRDISISSTFDTSLNLYSSEFLYLKAYNKINLEPGSGSADDDLGWMGGQKIINISGNIHCNINDTTNMTSWKDQSIINNLRIGYAGNESGVAIPGIGNKNAMTGILDSAYKYALKQDNAGTTYINAADTQFIRFRNGYWSEPDKISIGKEPVSTGDFCILFENDGIVKFKCSADNTTIIKSESPGVNLEISHEELRYLDGALLGQGVASKTLVLNSSSQITSGIDLITTNNIELQNTANFKVPETNTGWGGLGATINGNALHLTNVSASSHGTAIVNVAGNTSLNGNYTINNLTSDSTLRNNSEFAILFKINSGSVKFIGYDSGGISNAKVNNPYDITIGSGDALVTILCIDGINYLSVSKYA